MWLSGGVFWCFNGKNGEDLRFYESTNKTDVRNYTENDDLYYWLPLYKHSPHS